MHDGGNLKRNAVIFLAVLSIPATVWAVLTDSAMDISYWGSIGWNYTSSLTSGTELLVGAGNWRMNLTTNTMAVGSNLIIYDDNSVVIGTWNQDTGGDEQFIVGNGTYGHPANSLEVYKDGTVKINRQGDIPMGKFGY